MWRATSFSEDAQKRINEAIDFEKDSTIRVFSQFKRTSRKI